MNQKIERAITRDQGKDREQKKTITGRSSKLGDNSIGLHVVGINNIHTCEANKKKEI